MPGFSIREPIGSSYDVAADDVVNAKRALHALGYYDPPGGTIDDWSDRGLFDGIRRFQADNGLKPDGLMQPDGPTASAIDGALKGGSGGGHFDPNQPRDWHGRWTLAGGSGNDIPRPSGNHDLSPEQGQDIVREAKDWENTPYAPEKTPLAGGRAKKNEGADCSGSVHQILVDAGHPYPYTTSRDFIPAAENGKIPFREIKPDDRQPGDVVVYEGRGHMSVYAGNNEVYSAHRRNGRAFTSWPVTTFGKTIRYFRYQDENTSRSAP